LSRADREGDLDEEPADRSDHAEVDEVPDRCPGLFTQLEDREDRHDAQRRDQEVQRPAQVLQEQRQVGEGYHLEELFGEEPEERVQDDPEEERARQPGHRESKISHEEILLAY